MDTLQNMRVFVRVVEAGSFTGAAQHLNTTTAYASRAVSDLEAHLRTRLLNRTTRRIALTEAGERYLQRCEQILAYVDQAEAEASDAHARPSGKLKVHAMTSFGQHYVVPAVGRYQERYPDVQIELTLAQRMPDLLDEGFDVSLTLRHRSAGFGAGVAAARQRVQHCVRVAGLSGAARRAANARGPRAPHLSANGHAGFSDRQMDLRRPERRGNRRTGRGHLPGECRRSDGGGGGEGMGIGLIPIYSAISGLRSGELVWLLPEYTSQEMNLYALYPSRQYLDAKIRTWVEFLRDELPATLAADQEELRQFART